MRPFPRSQAVLVGFGVAAAALVAGGAWVLLVQSEEQRNPLEAPAPVPNVGKPEGGGLADAVWVDAPGRKGEWREVTARDFGSDLRLQIQVKLEVTTAVVEGARIDATRERVRWLLNGSEVWTHMFSVSFPIQWQGMRLMAEHHDVGKGVLWVVWSEESGVWVAAFQGLGAGQRPSILALREPLMDRVMCHQVKGASLAASDGAIRVTLDCSKHRRRTAEATARDGRVVFSNLVDSVVSE